MESEKAVWSSTVSQMGVNLPRKKTLDHVWKHLFIFMSQAWVFCWHLMGKDHELLNNLQHTRKPPQQRVIQFKRSVILRLRNTIEQEQLYASIGLKKTTLIYKARFILHSSMFPRPLPKDTYKLLTYLLNQNLPTSLSSKVLNPLCQLCHCIFESSL